MTLPHGNGPALAIILLKFANRRVQAWSLERTRKIVDRRFGMRSDCILRWIKPLSAIEVKEAENDDLVKRGRAIIAHGDAHLTVHGPRDRLKVRLDNQAPVLGHRPSVDVMFRSVAKACGAQVVAVMMTGMDNDGADAMGVIHAAGGKTIAQSAETCIVFGMPKAAIEMGHIEHTVPLERIVPTMMELAMSQSERNSLAAVTH